MSDDILQFVEAVYVQKAALGYLRSRLLQMLNLLIIGTLRCSVLCAVLNIA